MLKVAIAPQVIQGCTWEAGGLAAEIYLIVLIVFEANIKISS